MGLPLALRFLEAGYPVLGLDTSPVSGDYDLIILCTGHAQYKEIDTAALGAPVLDTCGFFPDLPGKVYRA